MIVEIDEGLSADQKINPKKRIPWWIFGGLCRETNDCFFVSDLNNSPKTLLPIIWIKIKPGSIIVTDLWRKYNEISSIDSQQQMIDYWFYFVNPTTLTNTQQMYRIWQSNELCNVKKSGTVRNFMGSYLAEFMWRKKLNDRDLFQTIIDNTSSF